MPRFEVGDAAGGLVVEGIYRGLLERERIKCVERDPRRADEPGTGAFWRPRALLEALEDGRTVVVGRQAAELQMHILWGGRQKLPWNRSMNGARVSPKDIVWPTDEAHPWFGCAVGDGA